MTGAGGGAATPVQITLLLDEAPESDAASANGQDVANAPATSESTGRKSTPVKLSEQIKIHVGPVKPAAAAEESETKN